MKFREYRTLAGKNTLSFVARVDEIETDDIGVRFVNYIEANDRGQSKGEVLQVAMRKSATPVFTRTKAKIAIEVQDIAETIDIDGAEILF